MPAPPSAELPLPWVEVLAAVLAVSALPLAVTWVMARREAALERTLPALSAFGAGAILAAALGHMIPHAIEEGADIGGVLLGVVGGYALFAAIERALAGHDHAHAHGVPLGAPSAHESDSSAEACVHLHPTPADPVSALAIDGAPPRTPSGHSHRHGGEAEHGHRRPSALAQLTFIGDALHNLVDGALLAASFMAGRTVGILTLLAIALHELPREVGTFGLFVHGGIRPMRAVAYNAITAVFAMAGALLALLVGGRAGVATTILLPIAAGTFLYIATTVGRAALHDRRADPTHWARLAWSGLGVLVTLGSAAIVGQS